ncbi:MAG: hypothetical protein LBK13_09775 [Spirochaetales bacterium]|nr:hypothetical protein [Spirochaetales bacterium]
MKKNYTVFFAVIAALIVLCAFWSCSSSDDDDGPSLPNAEEASLGDDAQVPLATVEQVYDADGDPYNSTNNVEPHTDSSSFNTGVKTLSSISSGKLTLELPRFTYWGEVDPLWLQTMGFTANPSDVQTFYMGGLDVDSTSFMLNKTDGTNEVKYIYADRDAVIQGTGGDEEGIFVANLILKQGWNLAISNPTSMRTAIPGAGYKWVVSDD